jgi:hypothetical protein
MRKGVYEILPIFLLIIVIVAVLFFMLLLSGKTIIIKNAATEERLRTTLAREAYVKAVKVEQAPFDGCAAKAWGEAGFALEQRRTDAATFAYWVPIKQEGSGRVCLAQLLVVI